MGETDNDQLVIKRIIDAPVEIVWKAWTVPEQVMKWWGPRDYSSPECHIDFREGGKYIFCMRAPAYQGGQDSYSSGIYEKIKPMELIEVLQHNLADKEGNPIDPVKAGMPEDFPSQSRMIISFKPKGGLTELTITISDFKRGQMYVFAYAGWNESIDKLAELISAG